MHRPPSFFRFRPGILLPYRLLDASGGCLIHLPVGLQPMLFLEILDDSPGAFSEIGFPVFDGVAEPAKGLLKLHDVFAFHADVEGAEVGLHDFGFMVDSFLGLWIRSSKLLITGTSLS